MPYKHPDPKSKKRIILALDVPIARAVWLIQELAHLVAYFKIGYEQIHAHSARELVKCVHDHGGAVFLDGKIHDIPQTVSKAVTGIVADQVELFNVHCSGGALMMRTAASTALSVALKQAEEAGMTTAQFGRPLGIGVTLLTSLDYDSLVAIGLAPSITGSNLADIQAEKVLFMNRLVVNLALAAKNAGLDGVVASPRESSMIREACGPDFLIATPGIRNKDAKPDDQKRTLTASEAIAGGSDFLVIGRPICEAQDPVSATIRFNEEIAQALGA